MQVQSSARAGDVLEWIRASPQFNFRNAIVMEITYWEAIPEPKYGYRMVEVWDDSISELNAVFKCTSCDTPNDGKVGHGSAGECYWCGKLGYWHLVSIEVDGEYLRYRNAIALLKRKKLIYREKEKVIESIDYTFKPIETQQ
jgi:hypothetical protein